MKLSRLPLFVLVLTLLCEPVFAQIGRNVVERGQDKKQIKQSQEWLARDQAELQACVGERQRVTDRSAAEACQRGGCVQRRE